MVFLNLEAKTKEELLGILTGEAVKQGYVKDTFLQAVLEREELYPTALPTPVLKIAVPHVLAISLDDLINQTETYQAIRQKFKILACVGNVPCSVDVPFFHVTQLVSPQGRRDFLSFIVQSDNVFRELPSEEKAESVQEQCRCFLAKCVMLRIAVCDDMQGELQSLVLLTNQYLSANSLVAEVTQFSHPDELLTTIEAESFHLYILDIVMPMDEQRADDHPEKRNGFDFRNGQRKHRDI